MIIFVTFVIVKEVPGKVTVTILIIEKKEEKSYHKL
jgi:hypothetical protein